jgi:hypothetical protein
MKNKILVLGAVCLLFIFPLILQVIVVSGQESSIPGVPSQLTPENILKQQQKIEQYRNITEWQLLGKRFQEAMLRNPVISWIDWFFTKISFIFRILFGMPYSLSITLLCVIALWFVFWVDVGNLVKSYSFLSNSSSLGISAAFAIVLAQFKVFANIVNFVGTLIWAREAAWQRVLLVGAVILFVVLLHFISKISSKYFEERKEKKEREEFHELKEKEERREKGRKRGEKG